MGDGQVNLEWLRILLVSAGQDRLNKQPASRFGDKLGTAWASAFTESSLV
jgi:hypothetical protein